MNQTEQFTSFNPHPIDPASLINFAFPQNLFPYSISCPLPNYIFHQCMQNWIHQQQQTVLRYNQLFHHQLDPNLQHQIHKIQSISHQEKAATTSDSNIEAGKSIRKCQKIGKTTIKKRKNIRKTTQQKNQTKNIPKNYGNAVILFAENNKQKVKQVIDQLPSLKLNKFMEVLRTKKDNINSISDLRQFWLNPEDPVFSKAVRVLTNIFFRCHSLKYIFNSRISNFSNHVKYRTRLMEAIRNPEEFTNIKQF